MNTRRIIIEDRHSGKQLATAVTGEGVQLFEGAWYFDKTAVDFTNLVISERTYICPYKGTCYWIDLETPDYRAENIGFTYFVVNPGYEFVQNKFGFYAGKREATRQYDEILVTDSAHQLA